MFDLALDKPSGDWLLSPYFDLTSLKHGSDVINQRIWIRCRIPRGWMNDPSGGKLGSRLRMATRGQRDRALIEIPLFIEEALSPMDDVDVQEIEIIKLDEQSVLAKITYMSRDFGNDKPVESQVNESVTIEIPI